MKKDLSVNSPILGNFVGPKVFNPSDDHFVLFTARYLNDSGFFFAANYLMILTDTMCI